MVLANFTPSKPFCCAQGRNGEVIAVNGVDAPVRWDGGETAVPAGMPAPVSPPEVTVSGDVAYHIARIDVDKPGAVYYAPPTVELSGGELDPVRGRPCSAKSYLSQAAVNEILVEDGGKYYRKVPNVRLGDSHGKGAVIVADTGLPEGNGITQWEVVANSIDQDQIPANERTRFPLLTQFYALPITGNGTFTIPVVEALELFAPRNNHFYYFRTNATPKAFRGSNFADTLLENGYTDKITYTVSGFTGTSRAVIALRGSDLYGTGGFSIGNTGLRHTYGASAVRDVQVKESGTGFNQETAVAVSIRSNFGIGTDLVIEGYPVGHPLNTERDGRPIRSVEIENVGDDDRPYIVTPQLQIISGTGFGAYATCEVTDGKISSATLENGGGGYKSNPEVRILSGGAEAAVVARPHLRGLYQCYYRYIDDTPEDRGGPIPSNLSDVLEVDAGEGSEGIRWTVPEPEPEGRATSVELWRTTGNQALTVYRVATIGQGESFADYLDDLTDEEVRDPDREGYEAMPILLPNGELNANRFVPPPSDKSVVVRFQDRYWYGVGGENPNAILFSEADEPESVPEINEIIPQQSGKGADKMTALIPFGSTLMLMQSRHAYSLVFSRQPLLDAQVSPAAYRGCVNQRSWDIHDGILYVMDRSGVYAITQSGQVASISDAIEDQFTQKVNWASSEWCFLIIEPKHKILRAFVSHQDDGDSLYPTRAFCYSLDSKGWWVEAYPQLITGATQAALGNGDYRCVYAASSGPIILDHGSTDIARGTVLSVTLTNPGKGYRTPPNILAVGGVGARFQATLGASGEITAIWILSGGTGYEDSDLVIDAPNDETHPSPIPAAAFIKASPLEENTATSPVCHYRSGFLPYPNDSDDKRLAAETDRSISLAYSPLRKSNELSLRTYYNGSKTPRPNVAERDRGSGFRQDMVDPAARLDVGKSLEPYGQDTGVVRAIYSGKASDDMRGSDRHVAVEIIGPRRRQDPIVLYEIDVYGASK